MLLSYVIKKNISLHDESPKGQIEEDHMDYVQK